MSVILLVEDHPTNRKLLRDILQLQFEVLEAESGEQALELLQSCIPDLMMLDMQLPGMDGLSLVRLLKTNPKQAAIPIIAVSAHALPRDIEQAKAAGCLEYITKPITDDPFTFLERISRFLLAGGNRSQETGSRSELRDQLT